MDKARNKTDKRLNKMEKQMGRVYNNNPALKRVMQKYLDYMDGVQEALQADYDAYMNEDDQNTKRELKKAYTAKIQAFTIGSKEYNAIIDEFTTVMAQVNQKAIDIANDAMIDVYCDNYNQVADDCRKAGIKVNGKTDIQNKGR